MIGLLYFVLAVSASPFKSKIRLEAENAVLRHQLIVLRRKLIGRARLTNNDRWFFVQMYRCFPSILKVVTIVEAETLVSWHRAGFRRYWRWKSRRRGGRPRMTSEHIGTKQRYAGFSAGSAIRSHKFARHLGRTSPSLRPRLSFRYTQVIPAP
jgi:hypothetical protein